MLAMRYHIGRRLDQAAPPMHSELVTHLGNSGAMASDSRILHTVYVPLWRRWRECIGLWAQGANTVRHLAQQPWWRAFGMPGYRRLQCTASQSTAGVRRHGSGAQVTAATAASVSCYSFGATHICAARPSPVNLASVVSKYPGVVGLTFAGAASLAHFAKGAMGSLRASQGVDYEHKDMVRCAK
jgi:hypothetical protein